MSCECPRCVILQKLLIHREDPAAPLPGEAWLAEHREDWPWWLLAGLLALIGVLVLPTAGAVPLLLAAVVVGALPHARRAVEGCGRVPSR